MGTTCNVPGSIQSIAPVRLGLSLFANCCAALAEYHERQWIRARLFELSGRDLYDIGISRGEVDYVASNRSLDPRNVPWQTHSVPPTTPAAANSEKEAE